LSGVQDEGGVGRREGREDLAELAQQYDVRPNQITTWKSQFMDGAAGVFGGDKTPLNGFGK
jgi:transposase-like protein